MSGRRIYEQSSNRNEAENVVFLKMSFSNTWTPMVLESAMLLANGVMAMVLYVARGQTSGCVANNLESLSQHCFLIGLAALLLLASVIGRLCGPSAKVMLMLAVTLWDQAWLAAFVAAIIPFRLF